MTIFLMMNFLPKINLIYLLFCFSGLMLSSMYENKSFKMTVGICDIELLCK